MAHLANRDVARTYWAQASGIVLVPVLALLVCSLALIWSSGGIAPAHPALASFHVLTTLLVIELIRRSLLRDREHYADLRASLWNAGEPLRFILGLKTARSAEPSGLARYWARFLRLHPTPEERRKLLDHPNVLFGISKDVPFLAGLLFGNLLVATLFLTSVLALAADALGVMTTLEMIESYARERGLAYAMHLYYRLGSLYWGSFMVIASFGLLGAISYLLAGTLGVQTLRESVLQVMQGRHSVHPYRALLLPALLASSGLEIGLVLVPLTPALPATFWGALGVPLWVIFGTLPFWLWLSSIRFFARRVLATHLGSRRPTRHLRVLTMAAALLLWPLIIVLLGGQFWIWPSMAIIDSKAAFVMAAVGFFGFAVLLALMLFVLAIRQVGREGERQPRCPHCHEAPAGITVADLCDHCGKSLAPWLLIESQPKQAMEVA